MDNDWQGEGLAHNALLVIFSYLIHRWGVAKLANALDFDSSIPLFEAGHPSQVGYSLSTGVS